MKRRPKNNNNNATDLIVDFQNIWSKFEQTMPKKIPQETLTSFQNGSKELEKIHKPRFFLNQGLNFYNKGNYKKAINCFQIVLDMDPRNTESKDYLSKAQIKLKESQVIESITQDMMKSSDRNEDIESIKTDENELNNYLPNYLVKNEVINKLGMAGIIEEISRRENAEKRIKLLSSAVEQSTEGVAISNMDGNLLFVNNAFVTMHGYESENILGRHISTFEAIDQSPVANPINMQGQNSGEFHGEAWHVRSDGSAFPTFSNTTFFKDDLGTPIGLIATHRDITKLKQSEEEIRKLSSAVEQSIDGITIIDLKSKITYVNEALAKMHGYSNNEMVGMDVKKLYDNAQKKIFENGINEVKTHGSWVGEIERAKKDGTTFPSYMSVTLLKDIYGKVTGFLAISRDITKRKQMEEELKRYTKHLEEEVKQRTYDLIQSEKMASLGHLVAGVAHEINNPLGYVNANTEIIIEHLQTLIRTCNEKKTTEILQTINKLLQTNIRGIYRIANTTKSLERFAVPTRGKKIHADINQGLKDTLLILSHQFEHRIKIHEDYGNIPKIICSIAQLNQTFTNIILNASEAMDKGNIWIKTSKDKNNIYIKISDDGKGIANDLLNKIFDPFFTTKKNGKGLGLSLSYRIIQAHNGEIKIEGKPGKGTAVSLILPMVTENG